MTLSVSAVSHESFTVRFDISFRRKYGLWSLVSGIGYAAADSWSMESGWDPGVAKEVRRECWGCWVVRSGCSISAPGGKFRNE
jgi:hypothetical protein